MNSGFRKTVNSPKGFSKTFLKARYGGGGWVGGVGHRVCDQLVHNSDWLMVT